MGKKKKLHDDLEMMCNYTDELESANLALQQTIEKLSKHIEMLDRQLEQYDRAVERKDAQWLGLRMAFQDALINNQV